MNDRALSRLRGYHRQVVWAGALWILAAALATDLALILSGRGSRFHFTVLAGGIAVAGLVRTLRQQPLRETACAVDAAMGTRNRFEAVAEVAGRTDPLAVAIRNEAHSYLSGRALPRPYRAWLPLAAAVVLLACRWIGPFAKSGTHSGNKAPGAAAPPASQKSPAAVVAAPALVVPASSPVVHFSGKTDAKAAAGPKNPGAAPVARTPVATAPIGPAALQKLLAQLAALDPLVGMPSGNAAMAKGAGGQPETMAGRLGRLTGEQAALALKIAQGSADAGVVGAESGMANELDQLAAQAGLPTAIAIHLRNAAGDARTAARQLAAGDTAAANEPAARALLSLKRAEMVMAGAQRSLLDRALQQVQMMWIQAATEVQGPEESNRGAILAGRWTAQGMRVLDQLEQRLQGQAAREEEQEEREAAQSSSNPGADFHAGIRRQNEDRRRGYDPVQALQQVDDLMDAVELSHIQWDLGDLVKAGDQASASAEAAASEKLMKLAQLISDRQSPSNDPRAAARQAAANLRGDRAQGQGAMSAGATRQQQVKTLADVQVASSTLQQMPSPDSSSEGDTPAEGDPLPGSSAGHDPGKDGSGGNVPGKKPEQNKPAPPPQPPHSQPDKPGKPSQPGGSGSQPNPGSNGFTGPDTARTGPDMHGRAGPVSPKETRQQSEIGIHNPDPKAMNQLIDGLIRKLDYAAAQKPRTSTLTIGNPAEAPPAYRSAVADYFESLARDPASPAPPRP